MEKKLGIDWEHGDEENELQDELNSSIQTD